MQRRSMVGAMRRSVVVSVVESLEGRSLFAAALPGAAEFPPSASGAVQSSAVAAAAVTDAVQFSQARGFYSSAFDLTLTAASSATIRYTTDGSAPTAATGQIYDGPLKITTTTVVRATAVTEGAATTPATHTYLFLADVIKQPKTVSGYPNPVLKDGTRPEMIPFDWEMDPEIVNNPAYTVNLLSGLKAIPTVSISVSKDTIFGEGGFYTTKDVEVPVSMEYLDPTHPGTDGQMNAGVETHADPRLKTALRVSFKKKYGGAQFATPLFQNAPVGGDSAANAVSNIVFRGGKNRSWTSYSAAINKTTFTEDEFVRQTQIALSGEGVHGTFVHLYVNGLYFGLYNAVERPNEGYGEIYYGGKKDDWFATNHDKDVKNGDDTRWRYLLDVLSKKDMSDPANYAEMKTYLDVPQFADYVLSHFYAGVTDWPDNNYWAGGDTAKAMPLKFFSWDGEAQFNTVDGTGTPPNGAWVHPSFRPGATDLANEPIIQLWRSVIKSGEFKTLLNDRLTKAIAPGGALSDAEALKRFDTLNGYIKDAVIAESARWGDSITPAPRTRDGTWTPAVAAIRQLLPGNANRLVAALRQYGLIPNNNPVPQTATLSGFVFSDADADGVYDATERKDADRLVYLDANNNGRRDGGEASVKTGAGGVFTFANLAPGTYHVRREFPAGFTYSTTLINVTVAAGQTLTNLTIGSKYATTPPPPVTGRISGTLFWDSNRNKVWDAGEDRQAGKTVFLDTDGDGVLDASEKRTVTDSAGNFSFTGLSAGSYKVRRVVPKGYAVTTPLTTITLAAGQSVSDVRIGTNTAT